MKGLSETFPFHRFTNPRHDKSVYFWSWGSYLLFTCNCQRKSMQEKESIMIVRYELTIPSLGIIVRHYSASLVMPNSYPHDRIFNLHLTTIEDTYTVV